MPALNRTRYDIYADIMQVLRFYGEAGISQIARRANLPIDRAKPLVEFMTKRGLLVMEEDQKKRPQVIYRATRRGYEYLDLYKELARIVVEITEEELELDVDIDKF